MDQQVIFEFNGYGQPVSAQDIMATVNAFLVQGHEAISGSMETVVYKDPESSTKIFATKYALLYSPKAD